MRRCLVAYSLPMTHANRVLVEIVSRGTVDAILPFVEEFYAHFHYAFVAEDKRSQLEAFVDMHSVGRLLSIACDGTLVGYAVIAFSYGLEFGGRVAFVDELFVRPAVRSTGLGQEALAHIEAVCASCGMRALRLEVEASNPRAAALYLRNGYVDHNRCLLTKRLDANS